MDRLIITLLSDLRVILVFESIGTLQLSIGETILLADVLEGRSGFFVISQGVGEPWRFWDPYAEVDQRDESYYQADNLKDEPVPVDVLIPHGYYDCQDGFHD